MIAQPLDGALDLVSRMDVVDSPRREEALHISSKLLDAVGADAIPEVLRRDIFELMRFVENRTGTRGNHFPVSALADRGVGAEKMMVDDDHVGRIRALAHPRHEAVVVSRTLGAETRLR